MKVTTIFTGFIALACIPLLAGPLPAAAYEAAAVSDGGTITGHIVFTGTVQKKKIVPTKDTQVCGGPREDPLIQVGADQSVQNAVVYLAAVDKGKPWPDTGGKPPVLDQKGCRFLPDIQVIPAGPLDVLNSDPVLHNTHGYYGKRTAFNLALPNQNQTIPTTLDRAGTVRIDCDAHGWMEGWIVVVDNPYYAVTGADGTFSIGEVPPGDYTLIAFQPLTGPMEMPVTVKAGETSELSIELKKQ